MEWKRRMRIKIVKGFGSILILAITLTGGQRARAESFSYPFVQYSPDGMAWTVREELPDPRDARNKSNPSCWYPLGEEVIAGGQKEIREPRQGEHSYSYERRGVMPVSYWKVRHQSAQCIHLDGSGFHGVSGGGGRCYSSYYSGWNPCCADCGEVMTYMLFYFSRTVAQNLKTIDLNKDYYYLCPTCDHMEQGSGLRHVCKAISANRYQIVYVANAADAAGNMEPSFHAYDDAEFYEGKRAELQRTLSLNAYEREGWHFEEWNLEPDGSGEGFTDGQAVLNLTDENYDPASGTGIVRLYAQWEPDDGLSPGGGVFAGEIVTGPVGISSVVDGMECGSVAEDGNGGYYVRANGITPFVLKASGEIRKSKAKEDQIDELCLRSVSGEDLISEVTIRIPRAVTPGADVVRFSEGDLVYAETGMEKLRSAGGLEALRRNGAKAVEASQRFTMDASGNGKQVRVTPGAKMQVGEEEVLSDRDKDAGNSILLTGDGEGPILQGTESIPDAFVDREDVEEGTTMELWAEDALSGVAFFQVEIRNLDHGKTVTFYPEADGRVRITPGEEEELWQGDVRLLITARDRVGNETTLEKTVQEFTLEAKIVRMLTPHDPIFQRGESGILIIRAGGYAQGLEIEWPESFTEDCPELPRAFTYEIPAETVREEVEFMIPLYLEEDGEYQIKVRARKGERTLECRPLLFSVSGSVLEELRTRLR